MSGVVIYNNGADNYTSRSEDEEEEEYFYVCLSCYTVLQDEISIKKHRKKLHSTDKKKPSKTWLVLTSQDLSPVIQLKNCNNQRTDTDTDSTDKAEEVVTHHQIIEADEPDYVNIPLPIPLKIESDTEARRRTVQIIEAEYLNIPLHIGASGDADDNEEDDYNDPLCFKEQHDDQYHDSNDNGQENGVDANNIVVVQTQGNDADNKKKKIGGINLFPGIILDELIIKEEQGDDEQAKEAQPQPHLLPESNLNETHPNNNNDQRIDDNKRKRNSNNNSLKISPHGKKIKSSLSSSSDPLDLRPARASVRNQTKNLYIEEESCDDDDDDMDFEPEAETPSGGGSDESEMENNETNVKAKEMKMLKIQKRLQIKLKDKNQGTKVDLRKRNKGLIEDSPSSTQDTQESIISIKNLFACVFCPCKFYSWPALRHHMKAMKRVGKNNIQTSTSTLNPVTPSETTTTQGSDSELNEVPTTITTPTQQQPDPENTTTLTNAPAPEDDVQPQINNDSNPKLNCPLCSAVFNNLSHYNAHITSTHNPTATAHSGSTCAHCGKNYKYNGDFVRHVQYQSCWIQDSPNAEEPHVFIQDLLSCVFCPCKFKNWSALNTHMNNMKKELTSSNKQITCTSQTNPVTPSESFSSTTQGTISEGNESPTTTTPDPENTMTNVPPEDEVQPQENQVTNNSRPKLQCPLCSATFTHLSPYNVHITATHPPTPTAHRGTTCAHCGKSYKNDRDLKKHVQYQLCFPQYSRRPYPCPSCSATFKNPSGLRSHTLVNHTPITPHICKICGRPCHTPSLLARHIETHAPPSERPLHLCSICGVCCKSAQYLEWHIKLHSEDRPYKCHQCPATYKAKDYLKDHVQAIHSGIKFPCSHCDKVYKVKCQLTQHVKIKHLGLSKSHVCPVCGAGFELATNLNTHVKSCHGEAKHECGDCGKKFILSAQLKSHLVVHDNSEGAKRFVCTVCGKKFKLKTGLVQHSSCHLAEEQKKHVCSACGKRFGLPWHLRQHKAAHHKQ